MATRFTVRLSHVVRSLCGPPGETCPHRNGRQANVGNPSSPNPGPFMLAMAHVSLKKEEEKKQQPFPIEASDFQEQEDMSCMGLRSQKEAGCLAFFLPQSQRCTIYTGALRVSYPIRSQRVINAYTAARRLICYVVFRHALSAHLRN